MPQPWLTGTPMASRQPSDRDFGTADPPHMTARSEDRS